MLQPPPPPQGHPLQPGGKFINTSSSNTGMTMVDWSCCTMVSFPWSRCQMCYSDYLSAVQNRFDLESGPWTIKATCGKETLYQVPIKFAHWRLKSTWFCPIVLSRLAGTCVADDAYLVQTCDISYFVATWWRGWFILVRHSNKKRDNVAKSRPGSNTAIPCKTLMFNLEVAHEMTWMRLNLEKQFRGASRESRNSTSFILITSNSSMPFFVRA